MMLYHSEEEWDQLSLDQECPECGKSERLGHSYWCQFFLCDECGWRGDHEEKCSLYDPYAHYGTPEHEYVLLMEESEWR
jgi:hypothetical protein